MSSPARLPKPLFRSRTVALLLPLSALLLPQATTVRSAEKPDIWGEQLLLRQKNANRDSNVRASADPDPDYDRLDGKGRSGKKVDVVEWEGNLEIHVYPAGSLKGLALKIDPSNGEKKHVMVIGYRFDVEPNQQLIRRAILGIDLAEPLQVYKDPSAKDYDKIVISNRSLLAPLAAFRLDPTPRQLYPDGHPALAQGNESDNRRPASSK